MIKILHVSGSKVWGGNEQQLVDLIQSLEDDNFQNFIYTVRQTKLKAHVQKKQVVFADNKKLKSIKNIRHFYQYILQLQPDIIHLHTSDALNLFYYTSILFTIKPKIIFEKKGMGRSSSVLSKLKYNSKHIDKIICVSEFVKNAFSEQINSQAKLKIEVVNDAVDIKKLDKKTISSILPLNHENFFVVGNIANHTSAKNIDLLIDVANAIVHHHQKKDFKFVQIGRFSNLTKAYQDRIKSLKLEANFVFLNEYPDAFMLNTFFDVFVLTSDREGGPTSILEAMYLETPIVATNVGIVSQLIQHQVNGYIAAIGSQDEVAHCLLKLYQKPKIFESELLKNKALIKDDYSIEAKTNKMKTIYLKLIS